MPSCCDQRATSSPSGLVRSAVESQRARAPQREHGASFVFLQVGQTFLPVRFDFAITHADRQERLSYQRVIVTPSSGVNKNYAGLHAAAEPHASHGNQLA